MTFASQHAQPSSLKTEKDWKQSHGARSKPVQSFYYFNRILSKSYLKSTPILKNKQFPFLVIK